MTTERANIGGVDSHKDTIHVAAINDIGHHLDDREFPTTVPGYRRAVAWLIEHGPLQGVGVEGTSSYGVGITTALRAAGIIVVEVNRARPAERRARGKTDRLDAYPAARSVLSGEATTDPKHASIEPLRALTVARRSAVKAQQAAWRQIGSLLVNAPGDLRDRYRNLSEAQLVAAIAHVRPDRMNDTATADTMFALRSLARRYLALGEEIITLEQHMRARATATNPALMAQGRRPRHRRAAADHGRRQPRPAAFVSIIRSALRHRTHPRLLRSHRSTPALSRRRPTSELGTAPHREGPHVV